MGDCLPTCPTGAISFVEREAAAYDEKAVQENMRKKAKSNHAAVPHTGCPGSRMQRIQHSQETTPSARVQTESQLGQWPCQIKLVPTNAPYFDGAKLLIAADCSAYAYARMHEDFMRGKITIIGCPKLDSIDYSEKLTQIIQNNNIQSVTVVRMEVPCCGGLDVYKRQGYSVPFDIHRARANEEIDKAQRYIIIGYGFGDDHLETHLMQQLRAGKPALIQTRLLHSCECS